MRSSHERISPHVSADDVLVYGARHGLVERENGHLVIVVRPASEAA